MRVNCPCELHTLHCTVVCEFVCVSRSSMCVCVCV